MPTARYNQSNRMKGLYVLIEFSWPLHLSSFLNQRPAVADYCQLKGGYRSYSTRSTPQASGQAAYKWIFQENRRTGSGSDISVRLMMHEFIYSARLQKGALVVFPALDAADLCASVRVDEERHGTEGSD